MVGWFSVCLQQTRQFWINGFLCILQLVPLILYLKFPISQNLMDLIRKQLQKYPYIFKKCIIKSYAYSNSCSYLQKSFIILNDLSTFGIAIKTNWGNIRQLIASDKIKNLFQKFVHLYLQQKSKFLPEI